MLIFALVKEVELPLTCYFYLFINDRSFTNRKIKSVQKLKKQSKKY